MTTFRINTFELTRQVFGIKGFTPSIGGSNSPGISYDSDQIQIIEDAESIGTSVFGTPIFESVTFINPETNDQLSFEDAPLITVTKSKHIVKTNVQGRNGTVKEFISEKDFIVNIRGILVSHDTQDIPYEKINLVNEFASLPLALPIESRLLNGLGIHNLVIQSLQLPENSQFTNVQPYQISCVSDTPIELIL